LAKEIKELEVKTKKEEEDSKKMKGKMAIQMGGEVHYIDAPDEAYVVEDEFV